MFRTGAFYFLASWSEELSAASLIHERENENRQPIFNSSANHGGSLLIYLLKMCCIPTYIMPIATLIAYVVILLAGFTVLAAGAISFKDGFTSYLGIN